VVPGGYAGHLAPFPTFRVVTERWSTHARHGSLGTWLPEPQDKRTASMFETISKGFRDIKHRFRGERELSEANIEDALNDIKQSLLEADVNFHVVKRFLKRVKERAIGEVVQVKLKTDDETVEVSPGQHFIKICQDELENLMGPVAEQPVEVSGKPPTKIMMVGLQGSGKTTSSAKLARLLEKNDARRPLLVAADVARPGAIEQLQVLGEQIDVPVFSIPGGIPLEICKKGLAQAKKLKK